MIIHQQKGFSLLELLLVTSIIALLGAAGVGSYRGLVKNVEVQSVAKTLASDLRQMRSKSMAGEGSVKWGVHIINVNGGEQSYELFSTPTNYPAGTVVVKTILSPGLMFSDPAAGISKDIIFSKISGTTTPATVSIISEGVTQTLTVSSIGAIN